MEIKNLATQQERNQTVAQHILSEWASKLNQTLSFHLQGKMQVTQLRLNAMFELKDCYTLSILDNRLYLIVGDSLVQWIIQAVTNSNPRKDVDEIGRTTAGSILKNVISDFHQKHFNGNHPLKMSALVEFTGTPIEKIIVFTVEIDNQSYECALMVDLDVYRDFIVGHPGSPIRNLDQMMDVHLMIRAQLGSARKKVKEIMEFVPGTIIELEQPVDSMCRLMVNEQWVASGDVIEVNGSFGVLIQSINNKTDLLG